MGNERDLGQERLVCEAQTWLRKGYITKAKIEELRAMLKRHRRHEAIEKLVEEMRRQWVRRSEWMNG